MRPVGTTWLVGAAAFAASIGGCCAYQPPPPTNYRISAAQFARLTDGTGLPTFFGCRHVCFELRHSIDAGVPDGAALDGGTPDPSYLYGYPDDHVSCMLQRDGSLTCAYEVFCHYD